MKKLYRLLEAASFARTFGREVQDAGVFDPQFYRELPGATSLQQRQPLLHYLLEGWQHRLPPHPRLSATDIAGGWGYFGWVETISPLEGYWRAGRFYGLDFTGAAYKRVLERELRPVTWPRPSGSAALVAHAFYLPEFRRILKAARSHSGKFDLFITTPHDRAAIEGELRREDLVGTIVRVPNIGRDIFPFVHLINEGLLRHYDLVAKVHSKRSLHRPDAAAWLENCLDGILGEALEGLSFLVAAGASQVGIVAPRGTLATTENVAANVRHLQWLCAQSGFRFRKEDLIFAAGSMFWAKADALRPIEALGLSLLDFEGECGQLDGTLAHALERFIGLGAIKAGYSVTDSRGARDRGGDTHLA